MMSPVEQTDLILLHYGLVFSKLVGGARMSYSWLTHSSGDTLRGENVKQTTSRVQAAESKLKKQEYLQTLQVCISSAFICYCKGLFQAHALFADEPFVDRTGWE